MKTNSSSDATAQFLQKLANLKTLAPGTTRINYAEAAELARQYKHKFPPSFFHGSTLARLGDELQAALEREAVVEKRTETDRVRDSAHHIFTFSWELRKAWDELDKRKRDWLIVALRQKFAAAIGANGIPEDTEFDRDLNYFQDAAQAQLVKHCANPDCAHPYFISLKRSFKNCSNKCAAVSQRRFKREWWSEHGPGWRQRARAKEGTKRRTQ